MDFFWSPLPLFVPLRSVQSRCPPDIHWMSCTSAILPEAISAGGLIPTTDASLFLAIYRVGSHLPTDITQGKQ
ncbi:hypothetical protein DW658_07945 [Dorea formicigenerans]|uniref:Uncharacterized protein n=1 Tax=Dorea formicigenerans TaxID=39486 RepID=A0A412KN49_9FIRM|nr:hypothetical protein DXD50_13050 [Dorea formicigenerans]RGS69950.1 hypothetical protein DWX78_08975 [Dorea formicigenerans]RHF78852.1 hypothetical protein DW658_07945 [Dorea formicigenerans]